MTARGTDPGARSAGDRGQHADREQQGPPSRDQLLTVRDSAPMLAVAAVGTAVGIAIGIARGADNWPVYLVVVVAGAAAAAALHARVGLSRGLRWGLVVFALSHVAGGMVPVGDDILYATWLWEPVLRYDNLQHAVGFGVVGLVFHAFLRHRLGAVVDTPALAWWLVLLGALGAGALNEIVEWVLVLTIPGTDVGGYDNTVRDLVADLAGGLVAAAWAARRRAVPSRP